jgi:hypothetical protein
LNQENSMSPKAAPKAAKPAAAKKEAKAPAPKEAKKPAKGAKAAAKDDDAELEAAPQVSMDEQEEMEDQAEEAAAKSSGGGSDDAALAAAASTGEMSASFKNFRHHPDMENFYRFIYENDLRHEALVIIDEMAVQKLAKKTAPKSGKSASH